MWRIWASDAAHLPQPENTEGLLKSDGVLASLQAWESRVRYHASEGWPHRQENLDHVERLDRVRTLEDRRTVDVHGVNAAQLSSDRWGALHRWIEPKLYLKRAKRAQESRGMASNSGASDARNTKGPMRLRPWLAMQSV